MNPEEVPVGTSLRTGLLSWATNAWYKWRHGEVQLSAEPVFVLGRLCPPVPSLVLAEARKVPWCSYRKNFQPLERQELTGETRYFSSDVGWGCTLRVGQMVLLTAVSRHLQLAADSVDLLAMAGIDSSPFALHQLLNSAHKQLNKQAGDWFSPSAAAHTVQHLVSCTALFPDFCVSVGQDGGVHKAQVLGDMTGLEAGRLQCTCAEGAECVLCSQFTWRGSVLLLLPVMLGRDRLAGPYFAAVQFLLQLPQSLGVIGGKKRSAVYFVGFQGDSLLYIDPHYVQKASKSRSHLQKHILTYQIPNLDHLPLSETDSSLTFAFYFDSAGSFEDFERRIEANQSTLKGVVFVQKRNFELLKSREVDFASDFIEIL